MAKSKPSDIVGKIVDMLHPLPSDERQRIIAAALTLLGESPTVKPKSPDGENGDESGEGGQLPR